MTAGNLARADCGFFEGEGGCVVEYIKLFQSIQNMNDRQS